MSWEVYIIESASGQYYTGITTDLDRRFREHQEGKRGARYFRIAKPKRIVFREPHPDRASASRREREIKAMSRQAKEKLLRS